MTTPDHVDADKIITDSVVARYRRLYFTIYQCTSPYSDDLIILWWQRFLPTARDPMEVDAEVLLHMRHGDPFHK